MPIAIAIAGAAGRMGRRLLALAARDPDLEVTQALDARDHPCRGRPLRELEPECGVEIVLGDSLTAGAEVLVDFSTPEGTATLAPRAAEFGCALVIGTTGLAPAQEQAVRDATEQVPVIHAPNFALGVNIVFRIAAEIAAALGREFDIEIMESHHNRKADAPSGTALAIARGVCRALERDPEQTLVHGRSGRPGPRPRGEIGMHALRLGGVVGEHTVHFASEYERIELVHRAQSRDVFAAGALRAAKWIAGKPAGRYGMEDVLFA